MIRIATPTDLPVILDIYAGARGFMARNSNPTQWGDHWPLLEVIQEDVALGRLFVCEEEGRVRGVFAFLVGDDESYAIIEEGRWRSDAPYGAIHRIAADGPGGGVFAQCVDWCKERMGHLRIDTHRDNKPMQHLVAKHGFQYRGIIYVGDGTPRLAYDYLGQGGEKEGAACSRSM